MNISERESIDRVSKRESKPNENKMKQDIHFSHGISGTWDEISEKSFFKETNLGEKPDVDLTPEGCNLPR